MACRVLPNVNASSQGICAHDVVETSGLELVQHLGTFVLSLETKCLGHKTEPYATASSTKNLL